MHAHQERRKHHGAVELLVLGLFAALVATLALPAVGAFGPPPSNPAVQTVR